MLSVMEQIRARGGKRHRTKEARVPGAAAVAGLASAGLSRGTPLLSLPCLDRSIPLTVVPAQMAAANASVARFLIEAGAIREGDIPSRWDDVIEVCQGALDAWVRRELGFLHCLAPAFVMTAGEGNEGGAVARAAQPPSYSRVELCWFENSVQQWVVGTGLEALESANSGMGALVLDILRRQSRFVYPLFTPDLACDVASYVYWCGDDDEETALDMECGDDADARSAMREDMVTRQKLADAFPAWCMEPACRPVAVAAVERFAQEVRDPALRDTAAYALALARLHIKDAFSPEVEGEYIGWGAVLSWREDDLCVRVYDDLLQLAHQSEFCDRIGEIDIALDSPQAMRAWQRAMRLRFKAIGLIDRLIHALSEGY
jgi:PRTRC genetic system protein F